MKILLMILGILLFVVVMGGVYFMATPWPVVRLLRKGDGELPTLPAEWEKLTNEIKIQKDVQYPSHCNQNCFDLFLPKTEEKSPLVLWVHGGAFVAGDKIGTENWGKMLAAKGYAVASMNYCHAPEAVYPAQIQQIAEALEAVLQLAKKDIDETRIMIAGDSAGAYLAVQFALCHFNKALAQRLQVVSPLKEDALKCLALFCGPYDVKKMFHTDNKVLRLFISRIGWSFLGKKNWRKAPLIDTVTPMDFVTEKMAPCYITDGNVVSFESQGRALGETLRNHGVYVKERYFDKEECGEVPHEYQMQLDTPNGQLCFQDTLTFMEEFL